MKFRRNRRFHPFTFFGLATFAVANTARMVLERHWHLSDNVTDPIVGFLYGVAISAMLVGVWRQSRKSDCSSAT